PEGYKHVRIEDTPRGKFPTPKEVADAVLKLVADQNITGQTVTVE
ncbi:hypothetical protein HN843_07035, partial [bacterium]|nr:hypothetical protein [bacterium]